MRLQVTVHRHGLAPVRNIFNTKAQQLQIAGHSIVTISDLLLAIDYVIPIQGEHWGCEDYAVETRLNDNQNQEYEVFHWQNVNDVFAEDDEVIVRPYNRREIRERARNGRRQISHGGQSLVDGGPWSKGVLVPGRPAIHIPPRGSTRGDEYFRPIQGQEAAPEEEEDPAEEQLQIAEGQHWMGEEDEDDEEDDEDYDDEHESASDAEDSGSAGSVDGSIISDEVGAENEPDGNALAPETTKVLTEIVFDENGEKRPVDEETLTPDLTSKKRKRVKIVADNAGFGHVSVPQKRQRVEIAEDESVITNGLSSPAAVGSSQASQPVHMNGTVNAGSPLDDSSSEDDSDDLDGNRVEDGNRGSSERNEISATLVGNGDSSDDGSSSSSESEATSSSASDSDEDSDSSSSSGESSSSIGEEEASIRTMAKPAKETTQRLEPVDRPSIFESLPVTKPTVAPGKGMARTQKNNTRKKKNKLLNRLKEEGKLPKDADFAALEEYLQGPLKSSLVAGPAHGLKESHEQDDSGLAAKRAEVLSMLGIDEAPVNDDGTNDGVQAPELQEESKSVAEAPFPQTEPENSDTAPTDSIATGTSETVTSTSPKLAATSAPVDTGSDIAPQTSSPKRARLDVASSRRMLFNALGVRNPRTPAAEQALREKLARPTRQVKEKATEATESDVVVTGTKDPDRWKDKLTIKAVECVQNKRVDVPPFPFKHPWQIRKERQEAAHAQKQYGRSSVYSEPVDELEEEEVEEEDERVDSTEVNEDGRIHASRQSFLPTTNDLAADDPIPIPSDFDALYDCQPHDLVEGAVIAYKELHMNERFEPAQSPYRVARIVTRKNQDLQVRLAPPYRVQNYIHVDEETGERVYSKFDVPDQDDEEPDDGLRDIAFQDMISPKFVAPSESAEAVIASVSKPVRSAQQSSDINDAGIKLRGGFLEESNSSRAHSSQQQIGTQRKTEINGIIKEAGFDSGIDEQLLEPFAHEGLDEDDDQRSVRRSPIAETDHAGWISSAEPASSPAHPITRSSVVRDSSVPSESMVESVRYPNLSQLGLDTPARDLQSSSHQDAQRMTPTPGNTSVLLGPVLRDDTTDQDNDSADRRHEFLDEPSIIPETQTQDFVHPQTSPLPEPAGEDDPFHGLEKSPPPASEDEGSEKESLDSSGLPNISQLSSQRSRSRQSSAGRVKAEQVRRSPRGTKTALRAEEPKDNSPPPIIKVSASQKQPRLSQIPEETIIVDLTQSSPQSSPETANVEAPKRGPRRSLFSSSSQQAKALRQSLSGLGQSSLLRKKRTSS